MRRIELNGSAIVILPVVKGLVSEGDAVRNAFEELRPEAIAISISKEELAGLHNKDQYDMYEPSDIEEIYKVLLETFGEVKLPPPCYVSAMDMGDANNVPLVPVDMNEELYSNTYCNEVGGIDLIRESFFVSRAQRKRFALDTPGDFAVDWDRKVNRAGGFRALNRKREQHMASALRTLSGKYKSVLAVIEYERAEGVAKLVDQPQYG